LVIVLSSVFFFWSLYCLLFFSFGLCIVFCLPKEKDRRLYNDQKKKKEDRRQYNDQNKKKEDRRQYNVQKKKAEDNTMTKRKRQKTIQ
jgi:cytochrome c biogenesis protein ResB